MKIRNSLLGAAAAALAAATTTALAGSGIGGVFNLGQLNSVDGATTLTGNPGGNPQLRLVNNGTAAALRAESHNGVGVNGVSVAGTGQLGQSTNGMGLQGVHSAATGVNPGVEGKTNSADPNGAGVVGRNTGGGPGLRAIVNAGAPPLAVSSSVKVANLNSDLLDGLDSTAYQQRVNGTCAAGSAIRVVNANGTVSCEPFGSWSLTGNAGTSPGTNFLGTTDSQPLVFRTNGNEAMRIDGAGNVGIGTASPADRLHVDGNIRTGAQPFGSEGFESPTFPPSGWTTLNWARTTSTSYEGSAAAASPDSGFNYLEGSATFAGRGLIRFHWRMAGGSGVMAFCVFDTPQPDGACLNDRYAMRSNSSSWVEETAPVTAGTHYFHWEKFSIFSATAYVDGVSFERAEDIGVTGDVNAVGNVRAGGDVSVGGNVGVRGDVSAYTVSGSGVGGRFIYGGGSAGYSRAAVQGTNNASGNDGGEGGFFETTQVDNDFPVVKLVRNASSGMPHNDYLQCQQRETDGGVTQKCHITAAGTFVAGSDFAESLPARGGKAGYSAGDVLVMSRSRPGEVERSHRGFDRALIGVYSTRPGVLGADKGGVTRVGKNDVPVAITGIVPVKATAANGPLRPGDLLTSSREPGRAMYAGRSPATGTVLGKALTPLLHGRGRIRMLVLLR